MVTCWSKKTSEDSKTQGITSHLGLGIPQTWSFFSKVKLSSSSSFVTFNLKIFYPSTCECKEGTLKNPQNQIKSQNQLANFYGQDFS